MVSFRSITLACLSVGGLLAQKTPIGNHLFGPAPLTAASPLDPRAIADSYLRSLAPAYELSELDLAGAFVAKQYRTAHNGVTHFVYRQRFQGLEVEGVEWTVNIDREGRVINAGGRPYKMPEGPPAAGLGSALGAVRAAAAAVNPALGERFIPFPATPAQPGGTLRFHAGGFGEEIDGQPVWYPANGRLRAAWRFQLLDEDGVSEYAVIVDDATGQPLSKQNLTWFQSAPRGLVFERSSPQPNPKPGVALAAAPPLVGRTQQSFAGDPAASPRGWVAGAVTAGNNAIAGANHLGVRFAPPRLALAPGLDFSFPLQLGDGAPNPLQFADAATANLFYWANRAHDLFYEIGFDEGAGNFQQDNFGRGGADGDAMLAYSQFAAAASFAATLNNAFFTSRARQDGAASGIHFLLATSPLGPLFIDTSYDAEVILHEYGHGVSTRLVRQLGGPQGGAMGEAWSDFFAIEFLTPEGAPPDGSYAIAEYFRQGFGAGIRTRPYSTSMEVNPLTYAQLGQVINRLEVHADGEIWVEALLEMRAELIRQLGEREGRRRARLLVIDGMKLSPPAPTMVDMRDAILLADRAGFQGASQDRIWAAFARRGLGVLAQGGGAASSHVLASFETPSPAGSLRFFEPEYVMGETIRIVAQDANYTQPTARIQLLTSAGDLEVLELARQGSVYAGSIPTAGFPSPVRRDGRLQLVPGDQLGAYYQDFDTGAGHQLYQIHVAFRPAYAISSVAPAEFRFAGETPLGLRLPVLAATAQELPFEFPFFGGRHHRVFVHTTGALTFDSSLAGGCLDPQTLRSARGIFPMALAMSTGGNAQPNENVYRSQAMPDSITFRWAGETAPQQAGVAPEPVNFAVTLHQDGRILLQYGAGNRNLISSLNQLLGCPGFTSTPVVAISNGHDTFLQSVTTHDSRASLENAGAVWIEPPFNHSSLPEGRLETPSPGERVRGILRGRGTASDSGAALSRIDIFVDDAAVGVTIPPARGGPCSQTGPATPLVPINFALNLATLGIESGPHVLRARVTNCRGAFTDLPEVPFEVLAGPPPAPSGRLESPADGAEVAGRVLVRGYALAEEVRVVSADILVDGVTYGSAMYGQERADACAGLAGRPNCPRVGFQLNLDTASTALPMPNGRHTLAARVQDETGRFTLIPETPITIVVRNPENQLPMGALETPRRNDRLRGTARISGHAYDPDGRVTTVSLLVDGQLLTTVPYGLPRPEACAQLQQTAACPNIGFELDLDTRRIANGPRVLGIRLLDDRGGAVTIPRDNRNGINVFVEN